MTKQDRKKQKRELLKAKKQEQHDKLIKQQQFKTINKEILNTVEDANLLPLMYYNDDEFEYDERLLLDYDKQKELYHAMKLR